MASANDVDAFTRRALELMNGSITKHSPNLASNIPRTIAVSGSSPSSSVALASPVLSIGSKENHNTAASPFESAVQNGTFGSSQFASSSAAQIVKSNPPPQTAGRQGGPSTSASTSAAVASPLPTEREGPALFNPNMTAQSRAELLSFVVNPNSSRSRGPPPRPQSPVFRPGSAASAASCSNTSAAQVLNTLKRTPNAAPNIRATLSPALQQTTSSKAPSSPLSTQSNCSEATKVGTSSNTTKMPIDPQVTIQASLAMTPALLTQTSQNPQAAIAASLLKANQLGNIQMANKISTALPAVSKSASSQVPNGASVSSTGTGTNSIPLKSPAAPVKGPAASDAVSAVKTPAPAAAAKPVSSAGATAQSSTTSSMDPLLEASMPNSGIAPRVQAPAGGKVLSGAATDMEALLEATKNKPALSVTTTAQPAATVGSASQALVVTTQPVVKPKEDNIPMSSFSAHPVVNGTAKNEEKVASKADVRVEQKAASADLIARIQKLEASNNSLVAAVAMLEEEAERRKFLGAGSAQQPFMLKVKTCGKDLLVQATKQLTVGELIRRMYVKLGLNGYAVKDPQMSFEGQGLGHLKTLGEFGICEDSETAFSYKEE